MWNVIIVIFAICVLGLAVAFIIAGSNSRDNFDQGVEDDLQEQFVNDYFKKKKDGGKK